MWRLIVSITVLSALIWINKAQFLKSKSVASIYENENIYVDGELNANLKYKCIPVGLNFKVSVSSYSLPCKYDKVAITEITGVSNISQVKIKNYKSSPLNQGANLEDYDYASIRCKIPNSDQLIGKQIELNFLIKYANLSKGGFKTRQYLHKTYSTRYYSIKEYDEVTLSIRGNLCDSAPLNEVFSSIKNFRNRSLISIFITTFILLIVIIFIEVDLLINIVSTSLIATILLLVSITFLKDQVYFSHGDFIVDLFILGVIFIVGTFIILGLQALIGYLIEKLFPDIVNWDNIIRGLE